MIALRDLTATHRILLALGGAAVIAALAVLIAASDFDLNAIRTLRAVHVSGNGSVIETQYNPAALFGIALIGMAVFAVVGLLAAGISRLLSNSLGNAGEGAANKAVAKTGRKLEQELAKVLELIRAHVTTNESYAKSLANAQSRLAGLPEPEQVRVIVSLLVAEIERMRQDGDALKSSLEESHSQIQSLRSSLSHAQEVVLQDPLTGTGNRRQFDIVMNKAIIECENKRTPMSLVMCDIDHFKRVNDAFGHQVGDELIKMFARVIEGSVRESDTVIRYGGEEFAVILPMAEVEAARVIAERIRRQFEGKRLTIRETNQKIGQLTASFGVAEYRPGDDLDALVQRADSKLYEAKSSGRNRVAAFGQSD
jgi:diguanylate cyclase